MQRKTLMKLCVAVTVSVITGTLAQEASLGERAPTQERRDGYARQREVARVQEHLAGAERLLVSADTSHLTSQQRAARARNISLLHGYRERGTFPRNLDYPGEREPYFVDDRGVHC